MRNCVDDAIRILLQHPRADCVRGVVPAGQNPHKMWRISKPDGPMSLCLKCPALMNPITRRARFCLRSIGKPVKSMRYAYSTIIRKHSLTGNKIYPLIIDPRYTVDIDNLSDWAKYEAMVYSGGVGYGFARQETSSNAGNDQDDHH